MELELKHLAAYLPYGLEVIFNGKKDRLCGIMFSDDTDYRYTKDTFHNINHPLANLETQAVEFEDIKPILHSLSDFNNSDADSEIEDKCKAFVSVKLNDVSEFPYWQFEILIKHHFDVFGLIDKGLAINKALNGK